MPFGESLAQIAELGLREEALRKEALANSIAGATRSTGSLLTQIGEEKGRRQRKELTLADLNQRAELADTRNALERENMDLRRREGEADRASRERIAQQEIEQRREAARLRIEEEKKAADELARDKLRQQQEAADQRRRDAFAQNAINQADQGMISYEELIQVSDNPMFDNDPENKAVLVGAAQALKRFDDEFNSAGQITAANLSTALQPYIDNIKKAQKGVDNPVWGWRTTDAEDKKAAQDKLDRANRDFTEKYTAAVSGLPQNISPQIKLSKDAAGFPTITWQEIGARGEPGPIPSGQKSETREGEGGLIDQAAQASAAIAEDLGATQQAFPPDRTQIGPDTMQPGWSDPRRNEPPPEPVQAETPKMDRLSDIGVTPSQSWSPAMRTQTQRARNYKVTDLIDKPLIEDRGKTFIDTPKGRVEIVSVMNAQGEVEPVVFQIGDMSVPITMDQKAAIHNAYLDILDSGKLQGEEAWNAARSRIMGPVIQEATRKNDSTFQNLVGYQ